MYDIFMQMLLLHQTLFLPGFFFPRLLAVITPFVALGRASTV
jgi:hypothetical protein